MEAKPSFMYVTFLELALNVIVVLRASPEVFFRSLCNNSATRIEIASRSLSRFGNVEFPTLNIHTRFFNYSLESHLYLCPYEASSS